MKTPLIITIGREYGSGGREIGEAVARQLGIGFYDKKIISLAAQKSGLCDEFICQQRAACAQRADAESRRFGGLFKRLFLRFLYAPDRHHFHRGSAGYPRPSQRGESAVIVGRCADYILAGRENTIKVFIHAPQEARVKRIMRLYQLDEPAALKAIATSDKGARQPLFPLYRHEVGKGAEL